MAQQQNTNTANTNTTNPAHNAESKVDSRQDSALDSAQFATTDSTHSASSTHSTHSTHSARSTLHPRYKTKQIFVGNVAIGGDAPISVQSMTFTKTRDIQATKAQLDRLALAGADIVRVAVSDLKDAHALKELKKVSPLPLVSDIHFRYEYALIAAESVDCIRINPGNIGSKEKIKAVAHACNERKIPIRIGVNGGSLEKQFEQKYGPTPKGMIESALYNIKLLEDFGFNNIKVSLKASDVERTMAAYRGLRPLVEYPFHLGVTEAGTMFHSTIKSSMALGGLLMEGIGDTMRCSITGELEQEIALARAILRYSGRQKQGITIISCPTCGRIEADLVSMVRQVETRLKHITTPLQISVMGCAVNALGEAKHADIAIAFGNKSGLIIKKGEVLKKLPENELLENFVAEVESMAQEYKQD
ncbi:flavodoxin-dependent (E)-4-hydroxy-3-methylbut-2-enyl-diphosphate synthase [Helicobacter fennelliae]|uniref:4-hydroxy-3-methylbut-2-en-1-yl diphosphate synthase (flavodoxin) n=3 Tax=Helicobacter TaxID=209 RepID=T1DWC8_9HELI|nr:flavodoxin-dependent (E)-4-hydroxy-3-methylbut-2-enyl-diphosphate synthase [Helicobacter fennelliae]GAD19503.1 1-hydroxy-2-methyl-2-(E)-butenyl 4-diphosphate synthase [Helicobacter fennelliae MRY12-0050]SQB98452.1 isoprenoid biosynthesis protein [Helicobacter fennelliae]STP07814.1 isoprenoid biosynthesis protein [Helicobacter fennelliae]STQ84300.1 isoprenoid biosynthesis protein [Helicobacter fennelliae]